MDPSSTGLSPRLAAPLAYAGWWLTGLLLWWLERRDPYVRFHAAQSVAAFGLLTLLILVCATLAVAALSLRPAAFPVFTTAVFLLWIGGVLLSVLAMWQTSQGRPWRLPLASGLADWLTGRR